MRLIKILLLLFALFSIGCTPEFGEINKVILKFDGTGQDFDKSYGLIKEIRDSMSYTNLI